MQEPSLQYINDLADGDQSFVLEITTLLKSTTFIYRVCISGLHQVLESNYTRLNKRLTLKRE
jgi:hypothetical protein